MDAIEALTRANAEFAARLREVNDEHWNLPTPCSEWDVRTLVNHLLVGSRMAVHLLDGMPRDEVIAGLTDDLIADADPIATFDSLADQVVAGFSAPGGLEGTVAHPAGDVPREMFVGFRFGDSAVHAWDLARAIGADEALDPELVEFLWAGAQSRKEMMTASGMFGEGPSGTLDETALLQDRYLDLLGRRP